MCAWPNRPIHGFATRQGGKYDPTYISWSNMRARCYNQKLKAWKNYGGRGITVCPRWDSFEAFIEDMGHRPPEMTLERIDNSKGYSPENCKWATRKEQMRNVRYNRRVEYAGEALTLTEWAERCGITPGAMHRRLRLWDVERAVTTKKPHAGVQ